MSIRVEVNQIDESDQPIVWRVVMSIYGLKQFGNNWMRRQFTFMSEYGLIQSRCDTDLWFVIDNGMLCLQARR